MSDHLILAKMRAAHIPSYALATNFDKSSMLDLKTRITTKAVLEAVTPINFYLHAVGTDKHAMRRVCTGVGLMAKALVLQGKSIIHVNLAGLLREIRFAEMEREARSFNPVLDALGAGGYVAIGDFLEFADVEQKYGYHAIQLVADYLIEHVERGGGLILGATNIPLLDATQYGAAFGAMLQNNFESYRIN